MNMFIVPFFYCFVCRAGDRLKRQLPETHVQCRNVIFFFECSGDDHQAFGGTFSSEEKKGD